MTTTLSIAYSVELLGLQAQLVRVEAHLSGGLPQFSIVGLASGAVREARERVRAAIETAGFRFPQGRLTVNLAPADLPKTSGHYDLAIALAILAAAGDIDGELLDNWLVFGELSLTADLLPLPRAAALGISVVDRGVRGFDQQAARLSRQPRLLFPLVNGHDLYLLKDEPTIACVAGLRQAVEGLRGTKPFGSLVMPGDQADQGGRGDQQKITSNEDAIACAQWSAIYGQHEAKEAALIAAAGLHNLLLMGPPGVGKSMIAHSLSGLMPSLAPAQSREVQSIHALSGSAGSTELTPGARLPCLPPFRAPHHTASAVALVGGGQPVIPGEVSLAHRGVLFLDELPEFGRSSLEALREPLETGEVHVVRMRTRLSLPARALLVAAMNPCPCGYYGAGSGPKHCHCSSEQVQRYRMRLSGPLLDRFDLALLLSRQSPPATTTPAPLNTDAGGLYKATRLRIQGARQRAEDRQGCANAHLTPEQLLAQAGLFCEQARHLLQQFMNASGNSLRVHDRLLRVALTVADLEEAAKVGLAHMAKAIEMRRGLDRPEALKASA
jgi:magnesium chelatase family protein